MLDRQTTVELARLLNEVVVSGDRIGSTYHDDEDTAAREWLAYCQTTLAESVGTTPQRLRGVVA